MALLEVDDLSMHFRLDPGFFGRVVGRQPVRTIKAVDGVSFRLERGEILGIAGESGCGKSTTCMLIARLYQPTGGRIRFDGRDIAELDRVGLRDYRRRVQMIFQDPYESLNPRFRVFELIAEGPRALGLWDEPEIEARVLRALDDVGLDPAEYRDRFPHQMSGGERQRAGIASALVLGPELVIADEPLSMLDVSIRAGILDLIRDLSQRMHFSCLYISHDLSILSNVARRLMVMYLGQVMEVGDVADVIEQPRHPYTQALVSAVPAPDPHYRRPVPAIRGELAQPIDPPPGCRFASRCPRVMDVCKRQAPLPVEMGGGHVAACYLYYHDDKVRREKALWTPSTAS